MKINSFEIATPISDLFENEEKVDLILKNSDCLECRDHTFNSNYKSQELFHCELQPIHQFNDKEINYLEKIKLKKKRFKTNFFSFSFML